MVGSRTMTGIRWIVLGLLLHLLLVLIGPVVQEIVFIALGADAPAALAIGVTAFEAVLGSVYLLGFWHVYAGRDERPAPHARRVSLARWPVAGAALAGSVLAVLILLATFLSFRPEGTGWPTFVALGVAVSVLAALAFLLALSDLSDDPGRLLASIAAVLGIASTAMDAPFYLLAEADLPAPDRLALLQTVSILSWILGSVSLALFFLVALNLRGRVEPAPATAARVPEAAETS